LAEVVEGAAPQAFVLLRVGRDLGKPRNGLPRRGVADKPRQRLAGVEAPSVAALQMAPCDGRNGGGRWQLSEAGPPRLADAEGRIAEQLETAGGIVPQGHHPRRLVADELVGMIEQCRPQQLPCAGIVRLPER